MKLRENWAEAPPARAGKRDEGTILVIALVSIIIATLIVGPMLQYAIAETHGSRISDAKTRRVEAVKGALRIALADPPSLYKICNNAGLNNGKVLADPQLSIGVTSTCYKMQSNFAEDVTKKPYGVSSVQANVPLPAQFITVPAQTQVYPGSGQANPNAWRTNDTSVTRTQGKVWTPNLPAHALSPRSPTPYAMDTTAGFAACNVYFPGTYTNPIVISGPTPTYFASGIYYFENTVTITGNANVVVGGGSVDGCTTDQEAAFYAINAPTTHNITGLGGTFVFGYQGRLIVNNSVAGTGMSLVFNQRYVAPTDLSNLPSASVNIVSVNGELLNSDLTNTVTDLNRTGVLSVPYSLAPGTDGTLAAATVNKYRPSVLVPPDPAIVPAPADTSPIVEVNLTATGTLNLQVPGYVDVPQGRLLVSVPVAGGIATGKTVNFSGGVLARTIEIPAGSPATFSIGIADVVVQIVVRIHSETTTDLPKIIGEAIVQVNQNGGYAVNSSSVGAM